MCYRCWSFSEQILALWAHRLLARFGHLMLKVADAVFGEDLFVGYQKGYV